MGQVVTLFSRTCKLPCVLHQDMSPCTAHTQQPPGGNIFMRLSQWCTASATCTHNCRSQVYNWRLVVHGSLCDGRLLLPVVLLLPAVHPGITDSTWYLKSDDAYLFSRIVSRVRSVAPFLGCGQPVGAGAISSIYVSPHKPTVSCPERYGTGSR